MINLCIPQPQDFVPLKNRFYGFRAQIDQRHPADPGASYTAVLRGVADLHP